MKAIKEAMKANLENVGIGYEEILVFGTVRCNVHIKCVSAETAEKWAMLLSQVFSGSKVSTLKTSWEAKFNKGTTLRPTRREGYLISVAA